MQKNKFKWKNSLKFKLIIFINLILILTILIQGAFSISTNYKQSKNYYEQNSNANLKNGKDFIINFIEENKNILKSIGGNKNLVEKVTSDEASKSLMIDSLKSIKESNSKVLSAYFASEDRKTYLIYPEVDIKAPEKDDNTEDIPTPSDMGNYGKIAMESKSAVVTPTYYDKRFKKFMISIFMGVKNSDNTNSIIGVDLDLSVLNENMSDFKFGQTGTFSVVDAKGYTIADTNKELTGKKINIASVIKNLNSNNTISYDENINGVNKKITITPVIDKQIYIVTTINNQEITKTSMELLIRVIIYSLIIIILSFVIVSIFVRKVTTNIKALSDDMVSIGNGDLTIRSKVVANDEIGILSGAFNKMIDDLNILVSKNTEASSSIKENTSNMSQNFNQSVEIITEVTASITEIARTSENQTSEINDILSENESLNKAIKNVSDNITSIKQICDNAKLVVDSGLNTVDNLINTTEENNIVLKSVTHNMNEVISSSKEINSFVEVIKSIAEQTNLLSLNASIESARAGEAGKGFAVVANEIRNLADESSKATEEIKLMIDNMNNKTSSIQVEVSSIKNAIEKQNNAVEDTKCRFKDTADLILNLNSAVNTIASLNESMVKIKELISVKLDSLASGIEESSAATEEISASSEEQLSIMEVLGRMTEDLSNLSQELSESISKFKL
ncbi:HAMP domain-containing protein [Clostridium cavendishii DSM 21758]|uniref:HAMP domain-containing protein n=1 Tax=Clostridium cavendishii DSM 21758 TaxID=1121302 RepID=A0A1M6RWC0_9CLOT|nr:methyl-accepting chemotaxis protein [Clostridium cavendishii]SHK36579.1 HAMP domain-containing protein [Clostridium cavendishii DSM 21758]